jgi:fimbrial chaperone protein
VRTRLHVGRMSLGITLMVLGATTSPLAASFSVNPTQVHLNPKGTSQLLTLRNESDAPLRFQLTVYKWNQAPDGTMQLEPTTDILFFPTLLTLEAKDERRIRVGSMVAFGATEQTYRLFVEELPPAETDAPVAGIRMLTKLGIPVFLQPEKASARATLRGLAVDDGRFSFELLNEGNVHFLPEAVVVRGLDAKGDVVVNEELKSWYVLASGLRRFEVAVPPAACGSVRELEVEARIAKTSLKERLQTPAPPCVADRKGP